ncbi:sugar phosphate isomerase/epimerase [Halobacillus salinarum]|uniref:Sugar phosphate isomerase/epimerase n=1 Tax=Halobacillus salinarum TaxID=2932257 RepID=A0ABY4EI03_9BACI|nr:sugar phosphate isomerase/epimerase [Halobacillus salinarum]UOQ44109.1 sugar phosphate isomerase/epimerase [Halobacillus salinarum]
MKVGCHLFPWNEQLAGGKLLQEEGKSILSWIRQQGFNGIETGAPMVPSGQEEETARLLKGEGLELEALHIGVPYFTKEFKDDMIQEAAKQIQRVSVTGAKRMLFSTWGEERKRDEEITKLADHISNLARLAHKHGMEFHYHNHNHEFIENERVIRRLLTETSATEVSFALDIGWVYRAGIDPLGFYNEFSDRIHYLHLRDVLRDQFIEIGRGEIEFHNLLAAFKATKGNKSVMVEMELGTDYGGSCETAEGITSVAFENLYKIL